MAKLGQDQEGGGVMGKKAKMSRAKARFKTINEKVIESLEEMCGVECSLEEYVEALKTAQGEVDAWIEASIECAKDDIKRRDS